MKLEDMHKPICQDSWNLRRVQWTCWATNLVGRLFRWRELAYIAEAKAPGKYRLIWLRK
jgi:hypothetical protein